jgi:4-hydroxybenzoate polyprenyltransferase
MTNKLQQLFLASRPISWVNTAYPFVAGYLLTQHHVDALLIIGGFYFLIPYNFLLYGINDVFDYESDKLNPRKGGVEGALIQKSEHKLILWVSVIVTLPFVIILGYLGNLSNILVLGLVLCTVLAYSLPKLRFKERPFLDSITSSFHFVGPLIYAFSFSHFTAARLVVLLAFFLWGMASHAFGAVQDIAADRLGGIGSIATVIGARTTIYFSAFLYLLAGLVLVLFGWPGIICCVVSMLYVCNVLRFRTVSDRSANLTNAGWKIFIKLNWLSGFIITLILIYLYRH